MDIQFWATTDIGKVRDHNEDNFLVDKRLNLFIVCDGMGGHAAGEVASAVSVRVVRDVIANNRPLLALAVERPEDLQTRKELLKLLEYAVQEACTRVFDLAQANPERRGMGTTCSLLLLVGRRAFIAHVGDSRVYLHRRDQVHQLTEDHSLVNEMIRQGRIDEEEAYNSPYKNAITRAVGVYESVEVDTLSFEVIQGDRLMLCSDGLSMYTDNDTLRRYLKSSTDTPSSQDEMKRISEALIRYANTRGGKDNITAVVVSIGDTGGSIETADIHLTMDTIRQIPLFHYLSYKELVRIINVTHRRVVDEGDVLIHEGERGEQLFIILRGEFEVERAGQQLAVLGAGRHFGEMALIDDRPRSATVRANKSGVVLSIRRPEFYELLRKDATMAVKLLWNFIQTLSARLRDAPIAQAARHNSSARHKFRPPPSTNSQVLDAPGPDDFSDEPDFRPPPSGEDETGDFDESPVTLRQSLSPMIDHISSLEDAIGEDITLPGLSAEELGVDSILASHSVLNYEADSSKD